MKKAVLVFLTIFAVLSPTSNVWSQVVKEEAELKRAYGARLGYGTDPDQFVFGAQAVLGRTLKFMRFAPSIDAGFGSGTSTLLLNADVRLFSFTTPGSQAHLYAGGGPALAFLSVKDGGSDTEVGLNLVTGLTFPLGEKNEYNLEVRFGFADMPNLRVLFGVMLGGRAKSTTEKIEIRR